MHAFKMKKPARTVTVIAVAQFDDDGDGLWLSDPMVMSDLTQQQAERKFLDTINSVVNGLAEKEVSITERTDFKNDEIEVTFGNDTAKISYGGQIVTDVRVSFHDLSD